ncbi:MAG: DUF1294 domain-containing protein [Candidatus Fimenecus sp.]
MKIPFFIIYIIIISTITALITSADKRKAVLKKQRISEKTLFLLAISGGAFAEYFTMLIIRHKTKHKKFMICLPIIIILQLVICILFQLNNIF